MSAGYAARLSEYPHKGVCGLPESYDTERSLNRKLATLAKWVSEARHLVVLTGAGISTNAGIPDFRGPRGVWTKEKERKTPGKNIALKIMKGNDGKGIRNGSAGTASDGAGRTVVSTIGSRKRSRVKQDSEKLTVKDDDDKSAVPLMDFSTATPTLTHRALTEMSALSPPKLAFCVTQNVDGLHRRSGMSRMRHAILHGCAFTETCKICDTEYFRDKDTGGMSFQPTGRRCEVKGCNGPLLDTLLDWEDPLPERDYDRAQEEFKKSDLALCLGTSLRIEPAASLATLAKRFVIVNLQITPYDKEAALIIRADVDTVMRHIMTSSLGYPEDWADAVVPPPIERTWKDPDYIRPNDST